MNNNISALENYKCNACASCVNACRFKAITMKLDKDGFIYPIVDSNACTECGMCIKSCPVLTPPKANKVTPELLAVCASDEVRAVSSSGGVFTVLAEAILAKGGSVCGAAFDKDMTLRHIIIHSSKELEPLRGSKYVQSNIGMIYRDIEALLREGKPVLFTGTPCQAAGLRSYLRKDYDDLYIMDVLCHGVPSPKIFKQYLKETAQGKKVTDVRFRDKRFGWTCEHIIIEYEDGSTYTADNKSDPYLIGFFRNIILRESCGECPFSEFPRQGDISVGDFWGISNIDKSQSDGKGTSLVYLNNSKGKKLMESVADKLLVCRLDFETTAVKNRIHAHYAINQNRYRLFKFMENNSFSYKESLRKALSRRFDIGIVSNYYAGNFGGSLTQYALYHTLEDMGYSCLMIERPAEAPGKVSIETVKRIYKEIPYPAAALAKQRKTKAEMKDLNKFCDMFVVGSDQLFQYTLYKALGEFVTLDWVSKDKKKIAYAASYGHNEIWGDKKELAQMGYYMRKFDAFSVREQSGIGISKNEFGVDAVQVLDPVFLCDPVHYDALIAKSTRKLPKHFIGAYILDPTTDKAEIIRKCQKQLGFKAQIFSEFHHSDEYVKSLKGLDVQHLTVEERLQLIKECDFFVTDSFHGTCLAIIMGKPFLSIINKKRGGSRFESLLSLFELPNRLINIANDLDINAFAPINYVKVNEILESEKKRCMKWLKDALQSEKKYQYDDYDILRELIRKQQTEIEQLRKQVMQLKIYDSLGLNSVTDIVQYIGVLIKSLPDLTIIISVKDTPGMSVSEEIAKEINALGIKTTLTGQHWKSYAAVIDSGEVVIDRLSEQKILESLRLGNNNISIISAGFKSGNLSSIKLNETEYSLNRRGFNFVIIDKKQNQVIDTVCFDLHLKEYKCFR